MLQKEKELFMQLCRFRDHNREKIEELLKKSSATPEVLGMLFSNRMSGVAYTVLKECKLLEMVDREFRNSLRNATNYNKKINEDYFGCIKFLSTELNSCGVKYALLKGAYLCAWYPHGCRTSNDVDILVSPEDIGKVSAKLKMAQFKQGELKNDVFVPATREEIIESRMTRGETVPFIREVKLPNTKYFEADVNFSLDYKNGDYNTLMKMLERTKTEKINGVEIRTLNKIDFTLHLCAHLYKEATTFPWIKMKRDMTFYKYCDIYGILKDFTDKDITELIARSKEYAMEKEVAYSLNSINAFFGLESQELLDLISSRDKSEFDTVVAPTEKKIYRYTESDPVKRFFAKDRESLLTEGV